MRKIFVLIGVVGVLVFALSEASYAQATRTFVSGVGNDANPCSRTAPCKTFAGAFSKTAVHGEINVLDPAGYGAVTINKSITILSDSVDAGVLVAGTNAIVIAAGATDVVELTGLNFNGLVGTASPGLTGVKIISAGTVHVRKSLIHEFGVAGNAAISVVNTSGNVNLFVSDVTMTQNVQGVVGGPTGAGTTTIVLDRVNITNTGGPAVRANAGATIRVNNSTITGNNKGLQQAGTGQIISSGNNMLAGNNIDGTFDSTVPLQ
jgi:hypothetical protein